MGASVFVGLSVLAASAGSVLGKASVAWVPLATRAWKRRWHDSTAADHDGEPWTFVVAVAERFTFLRDSHEDEYVSGLVRHFQAALEGVLAADPWLEKCVRSCGHCGIRFLTHPRNVWRDVIRCPFGCRQQHCRQCASERGMA